MRTFELSLFDGHPILQDGENVILLDTGNPSTIHAGKQLAFMGERYNVADIYMELTSDSLIELLGMHITTLLGGDILKDFSILFDNRAG